MKHINTNSVIQMIGIILFMSIIIYVSMQDKKVDIVESEVIADKDYIQEGVLVSAVEGSIDKYNITQYNSSQPIINTDNTNVLDKATDNENRQTLSYIYYTVVVQEIKGNIISGYTTSRNGYFGKINVDIKDINDTISIDKIYVVKAEPLLIIGEVPTITAIKIVEANNTNITVFENNMSLTSNYAEISKEFSNKELKEIIEIGNKNWYFWTQEQIIEYIKTIEDLGYTDEYEIKSEVHINENIANIVIKNN